MLNQSMGGNGQDALAAQSGVGTSSKQPAQATAQYITLRDGRRARVVSPESFLAIAKG